MRLPYIAGLITAIFLFMGCGAKDLQIATDKGALQVKGLEARHILSGSKIALQGYNDDATATFHPNGKISAKNSQGERNDGLWKIDNQDRLCLKFKRWGNGDKICYALYRQGEGYILFNNDIKRYDLTIIAQNIEQSIETPQGRQYSNPAANQERANSFQPNSAAPNTPFTQTNTQPIIVPQQSKEDIGNTIRELARDCRGCNLRKAFLRGANLSGAKLAGANLAEADLRDANLRRADLQGANLYKADLTGADLKGANLTGANIQEAKGLTLSN